MRKKRTPSSLLAALLAAATLFSAQAPVFAAGSPTLEQADSSQTSSGSTWYTEAAEDCDNRGLINTSYHMRFQPDEPMTRAQIAVAFYGAVGNPKLTGTRYYPYQDVYPGSWYTSGIIWVWRQKIMEGYSEQRFGPEDPVTREQMACILFNYANYKGLDTKATSAFDGFTDADSISNWAENAMAWAVSNGLINGAAGRLTPSGTASRAEITALLRNFCAYLAQ